MKWSGKRSGWTTGISSTWSVPRISSPVLTLLVCLFGVSEIRALFGCGIAGIIIYWIKSMKGNVNSIFPLVLLQAGISVPYLKIFLIFLKIGAILYGSGYVLFAFLDAVNIASVAVILAVAADMGRETLTDWRAVVIAISSMLSLLLFKKLNSAVIVIGGAEMGYVLALL